MDRLRAIKIASEHKPNYHCLLFCERLSISDECIATLAKQGMIELLMVATWVRYDTDIICIIMPCGNHATMNWLRERISNGVYDHIFPSVIYECIKSDRIELADLLLNTEGDVIYPAKEILENYLRSALSSNSTKIIEFLEKKLNSISGSVKLL